MHLLLSRWLPKVWYDFAPAFTRRASRRCSGTRDVFFWFVFGSGEQNTDPSMMIDVSTAC